MIPRPDFKYLSKAKAFSSSLNQKKYLYVHGRNGAVDLVWPALCSCRLCLRLVVLPV